MKLCLGYKWSLFVMIVTIGDLAWSVVAVLRNLTKFILKWHVNNQLNENVCGGISEHHLS